MAGEGSLAGLRVLIVEDDYFIADDLRKILKRRGAEVVRLSGSIPDAREQIRDDGFEVALLDLNIRGEMSFPLADELAGRHIPFAFVSGYDRPQIPPRFAAVPNWGKPYDGERIVNGIRSLWTRPIRT